MSTHISTTARHEARNSRARRSTTTMNAPATMTGAISPVTTTPTRGQSTWRTRRTTIGGGGMLRAPMGVSVGATWSGRRETGEVGVGGRRAASIRSRIRPALAWLIEMFGLCAAPLGSTCSSTSSGTVSISCTNR